MTSDLAPGLQLVGGMQVSGAEWDMDSFGHLFNRLTADVKHTDRLTRCIMYEGFVGERCEVRFFGIEVNCIDDIPEGMVGWDISAGTLTVTEPGGVVAWQGDLNWKWHSQLALGRVVGEFGARVPAEWTSDGIEQSIEFRPTANAYLTPGGGGFDDDVYLVDYDHTWPEQFEEAARSISEKLGPDMALGIEHYGSTSIPGMPAKPVIDILVEVPSLAEARKQVLPIFNTPNCEYWFYSGHMIFILRAEPMGRRTHHIHMAPANHDIWQGLAFRDYLRTHPEEASRYAALKHEQAKRHKTDRETYTQAKTAYVMEVTRKALQANGC